jgi:hypothetical protein
MIFLSKKEASRIAITAWSFKSSQKYKGVIKILNKMDRITFKFAIASQDITMQWNKRKFHHKRKLSMVQIDI